MLARTLPDQRDEITADLRRFYGVRLSDMYAGRESMADVAAMVDDLHGIRESALYRALAPDDSVWGITEQLLASAADALNVANWQRGEGKRADYPKPIPRPGITPDSTSYGKGALPYDAMHDWLGWSAN